MSRKRMPADNNQSDEKIRRSSPIGVCLFGESFVLTAQCAQEACESRQLQLRYNSPIYYLYSHAIELFMKEFLQTKGISNAELKKKWGHSLQKLWQECCSRGLVIDDTTRCKVDGVICYLDFYVTRNEFRYLEIGHKRLPTLDAVKDVAIELLVAIRPICESQFFTADRRSE